MSEFNDLKGKAGAFFSKAAGTAKDLASAAAAKTKQVSRVAKLNMDIIAQKDAIKKAYAEIGQMYYENHHDAPEGLLAQACQEIDIANAAIADMEAEISLLKTGMDEAQDADFESVVDSTAAEADIEVEITQEPADAPAPVEETPAEDAPADEPAPAEEAPSVEAPIDVPEEEPPEAPEEPEQAPEMTEEPEPAPEAPAEPEADDIPAPEEASAREAPAPETPPAEDPFG